MHSDSPDEIIICGEMCKIWYNYIWIDLLLHVMVNHRIQSFSSFRFPTHETFYHPSIEIQSTASFGSWSPPCWSWCDNGDVERERWDLRYFILLIRFAAISLPLSLPSTLSFLPSCSNSFNRADFALVNFKCIPHPVIHKFFLWVNKYQLKLIIINIIAL